MNINVFTFLDDEGRARHPVIVTPKTTKVLPILSTGKIISHQLQTFLGFWAMSPKANESTRFAFVSSKISRLMKCLVCTKSFAPETTSCQCYMCYQCQARNKRKSNSTSTSIVLRRLLSSMRTMSPSSSSQVAKWSTQPTPSSSKCVQQRPFSHRVSITLTNGQWWDLERTCLPCSLTSSS